MTPDQLVPGLLDPQPSLHDLAVVLRHLDRALVAEEVRRVQHEDVQGVALDPFAAVDQSPQIAKRTVNRDAASVLDRLAGAHLVRDRADAADARR